MQNYYLREEKKTTNTRAGGGGLHVHMRKDLPPTSTAIQEMIHPTPGLLDNLTVS